MNIIEKIAPLATVALLATAVACGGSQKKTAVGTAKNPPEIAKNAGKELEKREISKDARKDYDQAAAYFKQQQEAGWTKDGCRTAASKFSGVASDHSDIVEARYMAGLSYQKCGMYKQAKGKYEDALSVFEAHAPSLANLGEVYWHAGEPKLAEKYWNNAVKADPKIVAARNNLAWLLIEEMREIGFRNPRWKDLEEEATTHLSSALAVDNDNAEAYVLYGLLYMEGWQRNKNRLDLAKLLLDKGKERRAEFAPLYNAYGLYYLHRDNVGTALSNFEKAVQIDPGFVEARMNVGNITLGFRKYETAKQHFSAVLEREPKNYEAVIGLGVAQRGLGSLKAAEESYNRARKIDSKRGEAYFNLGVLYKDFLATDASDLEKSKQLYLDAKKYFNQYLSKPKIPDEGRKEAKANIKDIQKVTKQIQEVIDVMAEEGASTGGGEGGDEGAGQ